MEMSPTGKWFYQTKHLANGGTFSLPSDCDSLSKKNIYLLSVLGSYSFRFHHVSDVCIRV